MDYLKSLDMFLGLIKKHNEPCHAIIVTGDLFDHRLSIEESKFAALYLLNLVCNNCGRDGKPHVPVHFIHGTYTHDYDQYEIYLPMLEKIDNVEIFYTKEACIGQLHNGISILYLPQEYGDIDYSEAMSHTYDVIVGHGPMSSETKHPCRSSQYEIMHSVEQLGSISKICVFGHYHEYTDFGNNVYYTGTHLRWMYGENAQKVFFFCSDDYTVETIANPYALNYETFDIYSTDELRNELSKDIKNPHRFMIHYKNDTELQEYHSIMNTYKKNAYLKFHIISEETQNDVIKQINEMKQTTPMLEPIPALISYISEKYDVDASNEIHDYESKINKEE
jgi:DNA repair exonuclease SbcCD nuclease subunit